MVRSEESRLSISTGFALALLTTAPILTAFFWLIATSDSGRMFALAIGIAFVGFGSLSSDWAKVRSCKKLHLMKFITAILSICIGVSALCYLAINFDAFWSNPVLVKGVLGAISVFGFLSVILIGRNT